MSTFSLTIFSVKDIIVLILILIVIIIILPIFYDRIISLRTFKRP
jgi:hypothetical protein